MPLARAWLRELSGASGVALVLPAAIVSSVTKPAKKVLKTVTGQLPPLPGLP